MARKISHDMAWFVFLAAFLPFAVASSLLFTWSQADKELHQVRASEQLVRLDASVRNILDRIAVVTDMGATSREVIDLVLATENSRLFAANLVTGRLLQIQEKAPEISGWSILDAEKNVLMTIGERVPGSAVEEGFIMQAGNIVFTKAVNVDDQYLASGATALRGFVSTVIPTGNLINRVPGLVAIKHLPRKLDAGDLEIEGGDEAPKGRKVGAAILILAIMMMGSFIAGVIILYRRVLNPIKALTDHVKEKRYGSSLTREGQNHEISILSQAFDEYAKTLSDQAGKEAVVQTTQILAHDVRKPFSMVRSLLQILRDAERDEVKDLCAQFSPEIEKSIKSVDGMIADIMEVGARPALIQDVVDPEVLVRGAVEDFFKFNKESNVQIQYTFNHEHFVLVNQLKIARVFANIMNNALQAMGKNGSLWLRTQGRAGMVQFTVGNSGSFIHPDDAARLFEPFFTKNKRGGTGLGLAIAKKVVTEHGGDIWCSSSLDGVEFHFTLPAARPVTAGEPKMVTRRDDLHFGDLKRTLHILVCDDEELYRGGLMSLISKYRSENPDHTLEVTMAGRPQDAIECGRNRPFDIVIMDVDLGDPTLDGFDTVRALRKTGSQARMCIHSNRVAPDSEAKARNAGADTFLPKPMAYQEISTLITEVACGPYETCDKG